MLSRFLHRKPIKPIESETPEQLIQPIVRALVQRTSPKKSLNFQDAEHFINILQHLTSPGKNKEFKEIFFMRLAYDNPNTSYI